MALKYTSTLEIGVYGIFKIYAETLQRTLRIGELLQKSHSDGIFEGVESKERGRGSDLRFMDGR